MPKGKKTQFDLADIEARASIMATQGEVAHEYGVTRRCFEMQLARNKELREAWDRGMAKGTMSVRRNLFLLSKTHPAAAIFLAKNYCGMKDVVNNEMTGLNGGPIETSEVSAKDRLRAIVDRLVAKRAESESTGLPN